MTGWLKLWRFLFTKPIWKNSSPEQKTVLITLMGMVNYQSNQWEWEGEKLDLVPGQVVTSISKIQEIAGKGISPQNVRSSIEKFESLEFLTNESRKTGRLITIINWEIYQGEDPDVNKVISKWLGKLTDEPTKQNETTIPANSDIYGENIIRPNCNLTKDLTNKPTDKPTKQLTKQTISQTRNQSRAADGQMKSPTKELTKQVTKKPTDYPTPIKETKEEEKELYKNKAAKEALENVCKEITKKLSKKLFNPYQFANANKTSHPGAVLHTLNRILKEGEKLKDPWGYAINILTVEHQNYNERGEIEKAERYKKELVDFAREIKRKSKT